MTLTAVIAPTRSSGALSTSVITRPAPPLWWTAIQLVALAFHLPLAVLTGAQSSMASTSSVLLVGSLVSVAAIALYALLRQLMRAGWKALAVVSVTIIYFWHWGAGGVMGSIGTLILYAIVLTAAGRFSSKHYLKVGAFFASVTLSATMGILAASDSLGGPPRTTGIQNPVGDITLNSRPDIVLLVLDGYARGDVMRQLYEYDNSPFLQTLRESGFSVAERSVANYPITHLSIPALLNMSYVHPDGAVIGNEDLAYLAKQVSGSNQLVRILKKAGYTYIHGEADHWVNRCGSEVDVCLSGPPLDITAFALLYRTPVGGLLYPETGDPTTHLNLTRISNLRNWSDIVRGIDDPTFAFIHLQLPHPPLFLNSGCGVRIDPRLDGRILNDGRIPPERVALRMEAWIEQVECANRTVTDFVGSLDPDTVVVLASDHGPDSEFHFEPLASSLTQDQLFERYSTLTAVRLPEECRGMLPNNVDTVNTFRVVLSCLSTEDLPPLKSTSYLGGFGGPIQNVKVLPDNADK